MDATSLTCAFLQVAYRKERSLGITLDDVDGLATQIAAFLKSRGAASAAVRMQGQFYSSYNAARRALETRANNKRRKLAEAEAQLSELALSCATSGTDDIAVTMNTVYRNVLDYCAGFCAPDAALCGLKPAKAMDLLPYITAVQKEFATALESVLPRASLRDFVALSSAERSSQLEEVAQLVAGVRLFNWESGRGGVGLEHSPSLSVHAAGQLAQEGHKLFQANQALCTQYVDVLAAVQAKAVPASPEQVSAWSAELLNRRCACVLLAAILEDAQQLASRTEAALQAYQLDTAQLKRVVSSAGAVSKEAVYPFFSSISRSWLTCANCRAEAAELQGVLDALRPFAPVNSVSTLPEKLIIEVQRLGRPSAPFAHASVSSVGEHARRVPAQDADAASATIELAGLCPVALCTPVHGSPAGSTLGVAMPGDGGCGLYEYQGRLFSVSSEEAGAAFSTAPGQYLAALGQLATEGEHPEIVHLLEMLTTRPHRPLSLHGAAFPRASMQTLAEFDGSAEATAAAIADQAGQIAQAELEDTEAAAHGGTMRDGTLSGGLGSTTRLGATGRTGKSGAALVDVAVETPTHFVERHIDPKYQFSEWALRRQAIRIANIRQKATHGAQTDGSAFRRDNDTQVYLPRESGTQTGISVGSNTDRVVRYVGGLRGYSEPMVELAAANIGKGLPALGETGSKTQPIPGPANAMRINQATLSV